MPTVNARPDSAILEYFFGEAIFYGRQTDSDALQAIKELGADIYDWFVKIPNYHNIEQFTYKVNGMDIFVDQVTVDRFKKWRQFFVREQERWGLPSKHGMWEPTSTSGDQFVSYINYEWDPSDPFRIDTAVARKNGDDRLKREFHLAFSAQHGSSNTGGNTDPSRQHMMKTTAALAPIKDNMKIEIQDATSTVAHNRSTDVDEMSLHDLELTINEYLPDEGNPILAGHAFYDDYDANRQITSPFQHSSHVVVLPTHNVVGDYPLHVEHVSYPKLTGNYKNNSIVYTDHIILRDVLGETYSEISPNKSDYDIIYSPTWIEVPNIVNSADECDAKHAFDSQSRQFDRGTHDADAGEILLSMDFVGRYKGCVDGVIIISGFSTTKNLADDIITDDNDVGNLEWYTNVSEIVLHFFGMHYPCSAWYNDGGEYSYTQLPLTISDHILCHISCHPESVCLMQIVNENGEIYCILRHEQADDYRAFAFVAYCADVKSSGINFSDLKRRIQEEKEYTIISMDSRRHVPYHLCRLVCFGRMEVNRNESSSADDSIIGVITRDTLASLGVIGGDNLPNLVGRCVVSRDNGEHVNCIATFEARSREIYYTYKAIDMGRYNGSVAVVHPSSCNSKNNQDELQSDITRHAVLNPLYGAPTRFLSCTDGDASSTTPATREITHVLPSAEFPGLLVRRFDEFDPETRKDAITSHITGGINDHLVSVYTTDSVLIHVTEGHIEEGKWGEHICKEESSLQVSLQGVALALLVGWWFVTSCVVDLSVKRMNVTFNGTLYGESSSGVNTYDDMASYGRLISYWRVRKLSQEALACLFTSIGNATTALNYGENIAVSIGYVTVVYGLLLAIFEFLLCNGSTFGSLANKMEIECTTNVLLCGASTIHATGYRDATSLHRVPSSLSVPLCHRVDIRMNRFGRTRAKLSATSVYDRWFDTITPTTIAVYDEDETNCLRIHQVCSDCHMITGCSSNRGPSTLPSRDVDVDSVNMTTNPGAVTIRIETVGHNGPRETASIATTTFCDAAYNRMIGSILNMMWNPALPLALCDYGETYSVVNCRNTAGMHHCKVDHQTYHDDGGDLMLVRGECYGTDVILSEQSQCHGADASLVNSHVDYATPISTYSYPGKEWRDIRLVTRRCYGVFEAASVNLREDDDSPTVCAFGSPTVCGALDSHHDVTYLVDAVLLPTIRHLSTCCQGAMNVNIATHRYGYSSRVGCDAQPRAANKLPYDVSLSASISKWSDIIVLCALKATYGNCTDNPTTSEIVSTAGAMLHSMVSDIVFLSKPYGIMNTQVEFCETILCRVAMMPTIHRPLTSIGLVTIAASKKDKVETPSYVGYSIRSPKNGELYIHELVDICSGGRFTRWIHWLILYTNVVCAMIGEGISKHQRRCNVYGSRTNTTSQGVPVVIARNSQIVPYDVDVTPSMANIPPEFMMPHLTMRLRDFLQGQRKKNGTSRKRGSTEYTLSRVELLLNIACIFGHMWKSGEKVISRVTSQVYDSLHAARAFDTDEKYISSAARQAEYSDNDEDASTVGNRPIGIGKCLVINDYSGALRGVINSSCDCADHKVNNENRPMTCVLSGDCSVSSTYKPSDIMKIAGATNDMVRAVMRDGVANILIRRFAGLNYTTETCAHETRLERRGARQCQYATKPVDCRYIDSDDIDFSLFTGAVRTCKAFGFGSEEANLSTEDVSFECSEYRERDALMEWNFQMSHDTSNIRPLRITHSSHVDSEIGNSIQGSYKHCYGMGYCYVISSISIDRGVSGFQSYVQIYWYAIWTSIEYLEVSSHLDKKDSTSGESLLAMAGIITSLPSIRKTS